MATDHLGSTTLDADVCLDLLATQPIGRLAVSIGDHPDIFPVNHVVDRGRIVFRTAAGTKLAAAVLGRGVAYEVDGYDLETGEAWSVVVKGQAAEIERPADMDDAIELPLAPWQPAPKHRFVAIEPVAISGRRFPIADASQWSDGVTMS